MSSFPSIRIEGGLLGQELLDQVLAADVPGQKPADFGLEPKRNLTDEIAAVFADARALWGVFQNRIARLPENDLGTTATRDQWVLPFLALLGYQVRYNSRALEVDGQPLPVSHRAAESDDAPPIHIVGARQELGRVPASGRPRFAPHSLVQEYLNRTEHVWGIVTNGLTLRLLRDSTLVRRQAYLEFDLQAIFEEQRFHDFAALYRLIHRSRLPKGMADASECLLEKYHAQTIEQGGRVREHLRDGVEECLKLLGNGFLRHPANAELRQKLQSQQLSAAQFYRQLFRIVYRFLFLLVSEDRGLISPNLIYRDHYGIARLRRMLDVRAAWTDHADLWLSLRTLFRLFQDDKLSAVLELAPLNGELFSTQTLDGCTLSNRDLLAAFWYLAYYQERAGAPARRVNYAALDVEELGSVYESLLEFHPDITALPTPHSALPALHFDLIFGSERKTTGSFYTPPELVNELIESALMPVVQERLRQAESQTKSSAATKHSPFPPTAGGEGRGEVGRSPIAERALLSLKIIDVACGSGHMLLAAARRVGKELAKLRTGEDEPAPERVRESIRDVISHCIYGVDRNPLAVDLCRVALWLESHTAGKPLTFLDHRIRCGDSLVGVFDLSVLAKGIPDKAFDPCEGDDKATARAAAKRNKAERGGEMQDLFAVRDNSATDVLSRHSRDVDAIPDDSPELIRRKKELFEASHRDPAWLRQKQACDLWTAAFFQNLGPQTPDATLAEPTPPATAGPQTTIITAAALADHLYGRPIDARLYARASVLSLSQPFFHWPLEFPEVFTPSGTRRAEAQGGEDGARRAEAQSEGGFDVILSNPPWEHIEIKEQEFFAARESQIARAGNKTARIKLITALKQTNPTLYDEFSATVHAADCLGKFVRESKRFALTAAGRINTFAVFAETIRHLISQSGRAGIILPTAVATDATCQDFFADINNRGELASLYDFENREGLFPSVDSRFKFVTMTLRGVLSGANAPSDFAFFLTKTDQLRDRRRRFTLTAADLALLNPNTKTCPVFRTGIDAALTENIYRRIPILNREGIVDGNPWGVQITRLFNMGIPDVLRRCHQGAKPPSQSGWQPMYEGKMFASYNHRAASVELRPDNAIRAAQSVVTAEEQLANPKFITTPAYWIQTEAVVEAVPKGWGNNWVVAYKDITASTNERTMIATILPFPSCNFTIRCAFFASRDVAAACCFLANLNSIAFDYLARQSLSGLHLSDYIVKQLPVLPPSFYRAADVAYVASRVLELVYTADDMQPLADALRATASFPVPSTPYRWDEARRALLRAELDAWYARAYGLTRDELRYILDPADVYGPDFPGETFRVLKEKELAKYGEYRTRRLVLEAWDRLQPREP